MLFCKGGNLYLTLPEGEGNDRTVCGDRPDEADDGSCILRGKEIKRHGLTTDGKGRRILAQLLRKTDVAGYEVSS
jgi:hypothetical protein